MAQYAQAVQPGTAGETAFRMIQVCAIEPWVTPAFSSRW
jgi:hypothetical protein